MSATTRNQVFSAVHTVGGLIPADMLVRISEGRDVPGSTPADYRVVGLRSVGDDAERHWDYLKAVWRDLRTKLPAAPEAETPTDPTGLATTQWLEPLFAELGYGRLTTVGQTGIPADDQTKSFEVSHRWNHVPIHLAAWNHTLDKRPGGAGTVPPQSLVQECLNRTEAHLWAVLTNGRRLRLLRDSSALATAAYVEFDLEAIFDGELFSEWVLLYRLLHVSRFETAPNAAPSTCWLEKWRTEAITSGTRALEQLRKGVQDAITTLGTGFLRHPDNARLRADLDIKTYHYALLRLVYRLLFLFVAEDREALLRPNATEQAKDRYTRYFSSARLRRQAQRRRGTAHGDLYQALRIVLAALGNDDGREELGLPGLGGIYDDVEADKPLHGLSLPNDALLNAVRALSIVRDAGSRRNRVVDYRNLGAEELGSIYESLLELVPQHGASDRTFALVELPGNARKTTGSYYTPSSLIDCLLDSALDPVIDDAVKRGEIRATRSGQPDARDAIVDELLSLTVCDPACGSGHFLVAAARRIAKRVAAVREQNPEPTLDAVRHALHEVVARCIYGVDLNPMAVELAKVSLWLEALEPGKPLGFLDAHVKHGNALIGATPALLKKGIPDEAFTPIEGDDKKVAAAVKKRNAKERAGQLSFHTEERIWVSNAAFAASLRGITGARSDTLRDVRLQSSRFRELEESAEYLRALHIADAWSAAFVWPKRQGAPTPVTEAVFRDLQSPRAGIPVSTNEEIIRLAQQYKFFHWHLEFPEVFHVLDAPGAEADSYTGWTGSFSCVLGNPPWEQVQLDPREFFAAVRPEIAEAANTAVRNRMLEKLATDDPELFEAFVGERRKNDGFKHFVHASGRFPLTAYGRLNTYSLFAELDRMITVELGRSGQIVPSGIATDSFNQYFFKDLVEQGSLVSLYDFENEDKVFPGVHNQFRFCLLTLSGVREYIANISLAFKVRQADQISARSFELTPADVTLLNPNTGTCPVFRTRRDAEITLDIYKRLPVMVQEGDPGGNPWGVRFHLMFMMGADSHVFHVQKELEDNGWTLVSNVFERSENRMLPLYEAKMLHSFDHRFATYLGATREQLNKGTLPRITPDKHGDAEISALPRYWVEESEVHSKVSAKSWPHEWLFGWRAIGRAADERTMIASFMPLGAVGHTLLLATADHGLPILAPIWSSFIFDYVIRQKIGGASLAFFYVKQIPVPAPQMVAPHASFIERRCLELAYTSHDMTPFARDLGDIGTPFRWEEERRQVIRAELDALFFHLYGISREDVGCILDTFPIVKRKDEAKYGTYRTKELILSIYDRMAAVGISPNTPLVDGQNFTSSLTPPPGHGPRHTAR